MSELEVLDTSDEALLRKLVEKDRAGAWDNKYYIVGFDPASEDGLSAKRLTQAGMITSGHGYGMIIVQGVKASGYAYVRKMDDAAAAEERRRQERREDKAHDWKISVFTALVGVLGALGGTVLGYWLGAARPFL